VRAGRILNRIWLPLALVAAWQVGASVGLINPLFFPAPSALVATAGHMLASGELARQLGVTVRRMLLGFFVGGALGLVCGVLMGTVEMVRRTLEPVVAGLFTTPKITLLPMLMLLLGVGESARVTLVAAGSFVMVALNAADAVRGINRTYLEMASNYGASRAMLFRKVYLPASLPQVFTGIRLAVGRALIITVAVELISCPDGIGSMIWVAWQTLATEKLYVGVIATAALGALLHHSLQRLENAVIPWKPA